MCGRGYVEVFGRRAEQKIAHTAAREVCFVTAGSQHIYDPERGTVAWVIQTRHKHWMRAALIGFERRCREEDRLLLVKGFGNYSVLEKELEGHILQRGLMRRFQHHGATGAGTLCFQPSRGANAPAIARL